MSSGFSFGAKQAATPPFGQTFGSQSGGTMTLGPPATTAAPQFGLTAAPQFGLTAPPQFGMTTASTSGFQLGSNTATTGFALGATPLPTSTLNFNNPSLNFKPPTTGLSFGTPSTGVQGITTTPSFGAPTGGGLFGTSTAPPTTSTLTGILANSATPSLFGTSAPTLNFGANSAVPTLNFGTPTSSVAPTVNFGATSAAPTVNFGAATAPTANFGATSIAPAVNFGATPIAPTVNFGATPIAPTVNFGATPLPSTVNFGATPTSLNFGFGGTTTATSTFGLGGLVNTTLGSTLTPKTTVTTQANVGLGGLPNTQPKTTTTQQVDVAPKDQPLPNEILQTVENFKNYVKDQKAFSSDVSRCSVKVFRKVEADIDLINNLLSEVENQLQKNRAVAQKLKYDTAKGLQHVEIAQRTYNTPPGLQYDNSAPLMYFFGLVDSFEKEMQAIKLQIENIDKYVMNTGQPVTLTSQELAVGMRRLHETFVALAGRLQSVHNQVESQKEQYLNLRKYMLSDATNIFEQVTSEPEPLNIQLQNIVYQVPKITAGPTPFNSMGNSGIAQIKKTPPSYPGTSNLGLSQVYFGRGYGGATQSANLGNLGGSTFGSSFGQSFQSPSAFQLQKPPIGNKRGKP